MIDLYTWPTPNGHKIHIFPEESRSPQQMDPASQGYDVELSRATVRRGT